MTAAERRLRTAAVSARRFIARARLVVIQSHSSNPAGSSDVRHVTDERGLEWIAEHDRVLRKLDAAIAGSTP
jgi:hypothetical protein